MPGGSVPPLVIQPAIGTADEDVDAVRAAGHDHGIPTESAPERLIAMPGGPVPPLVVERVVGAADENVDPVRTPAHRGRVTAQDPAERFERRGRRLPPARVEPL